MNLKFVVTLFTLILLFGVEGKKTGRSRSSGSGRGSSRKTNSNSQPAPTSFNNPQTSAPKPSLSGWQERPAPKTVPSTNNQRHSYPSSGTGLSGNKPKQPPTNQENLQTNRASNNFADQQPKNNQPSHSYPQSTGLSGSPGNNPQQQSMNTGNMGGNQHGYPQSPGSGLSGSGQSSNSYPHQGGYGASGQQGSGFSQPGSGHNGYPQAPPPYSGYRPGDTSRQNNAQNQYGNNAYNPQGPPPPYTNVGSHYGGYGHGSNNPGYGSQMPGYFGNYGKNNGGMSRGGSALAGVGIAGAGIGTVLTGLALWNLARSTGHSRHTVIYDNRGQPVAVASGNDTTPVADSILADLVNCSLTISNDNKTEVLAIPCAIATSFTPEADVKDAGINESAKDNTKCTVTVLTKAGKEFMTIIPCSILLNTAAQNNVTEPPEYNVTDPPILETSHQGDINNNTNEADHFKDDYKYNTTDNAPTALTLTGAEANGNTYLNLNCTLQPAELRDPINPCYSVNHELTVVPLSTTTVPN